jgi:hypothetical protein
MRHEFKNIITQSVKLLIVVLFILKSTNCALTYDFKKEKIDFVSYLTHEDLYKLKPKLAKKSVENKNIGKIRLSLKGELRELPASTFIILSSELPVLNWSERFGFFLPLGFPKIPLIIAKSIPAYKEPYQNVYYFDRLTSEQEIFVPAGEYYASISNGEIEKGIDIDLYPFFPRWNQGFLGLFGYAYNEKNQTLDEYSGQCKSKSVKNIHWLGRVYDPRGLNHTVCSKLIVKEGEIAEIRIQSKNSEFRHIRTALAWVPGIMILTPLFFGSSMRTFDHTLEVIYTKGK